MKAYICQNFFTFKPLNPVAVNREKTIKMKTKASIFTTITLGIALAGTIAACNKAKTTDKPAAEGSRRRFD